MLRYPECKAPIRARRWIFFRLSGRIGADFASSVSLTSIVVNVSGSKLTCLSIRVKKLLKSLIERSGKPRQIRCDKGPAFTHQRLRQWIQQNPITLHFIQGDLPRVLLARVFWLDSVMVPQHPLVFFLRRSPLDDCRVAQPSVRDHISSLGFVIPYADPPLLKRRSK